VLTVVAQILLIKPIRNLLSWQCNNIVVEDDDDNDNNNNNNNNNPI
jgi:hypothetical protein